MAGLSAIGKFAADIGGAAANVISAARGGGTTAAGQNAVSANQFLDQLAQVKALDAEGDKMKMAAKAYGVEREAINALLQR
jgi:hypothetical protein